MLGQRFFSGPFCHIKAKDFAAKLTSVNVQTKDLQSETMITQEHIDNNAAVRRILLERGVVPEDLPAEENVKKVERRLASEKKKAIENKRKKRFIGSTRFCTFAVLQT